MGIANYERQMDSAFALFNRNLLLNPKPEDQARALLWIGKLQAQRGDNAAAQQAWAQAQAVDKTNYYSQRARDLLEGRGLFQSPSVIELKPDLVKERNDAEAWVRIRFNLPPETNLSGPGTLATDRPIQR